MSRGVLGTAGHIDHGKTALVAALTGVDTDRLKEEKARGITIELGFAELQGLGGRSLGVVDVPGHEAFVRTMVAGATGMDLVLLVVAADEGVMPQTREHLAILELLGVREVVVAITKVDLVDEEWLALVDDEIGELLEGTPYRDAPRLPVSSTTGQGMDQLRRALDESSERAVTDRTGDLARLPVDRVFTVQGTGTVVTGTLWSGALTSGERVRILPEGKEARVRGLQVHGQPVERAEGGARTAVALAAPGLGRGDMHRGSCLVTDAAWTQSWMLTVRVTVLSGAAWSLEHNQRVRVHLGTEEVLARVVVLHGPQAIAPGGTGWIQLRLEAPITARCRDRVVLRSYSPLTTLGGGVVAEPAPRKRRSVDGDEGELLAALVDGEPDAALAALLDTASWEGVEVGELPVLLGFPPQACEAALSPEGADHLRAGSRVFSPGVAEEGRRLILAALDEEHRTESLREAAPLNRLRPALPTWAHPRLPDALIEDLAAEGSLELVGGGARRPGFLPTPTPEQEAACHALEKVFRDAGLSAPTVPELPEALSSRDDIWALLRRMEGQGAVRAIADGIYVDAQALDGAIARVQDEMGGRAGLGPSDFRDALDVTRKHLIPLLNYFDGLGVTAKDGQLRSVPKP